MLVFDIYSLQITARIGNVPASQSLHGVLWQDAKTAWVASTTKNVTSIVDVSTSKVVSQIPVAGPMASVDGKGTLLASAAQNSVFLIAPSLEILSTIPNVLSPQDILSVPLQLATTGSGNSVVQFSTSTPAMSSTTATVPGAFGLAPGIIGVGVLPIPYALITSPISNAVYFLQPRAAPPEPLSVTNGASFSTQGSAPGSLSSLFANTGATQSFSASTLPLPTSMGSVSLLVGGGFSYNDSTGRWDYSSQGATRAGLLFVGPKQINFQIPPGIQTTDTVPLQLQAADGSTLSGTTKISALSPGIFTLAANGAGQGAVLNQDYSINFGTNPATRGSVIQIYATGAGATNPPLLPGEAAPVSGNPLVVTVTQPTVTIGGKNAAVQFSGMAPGFVGVWQINAIVPQDVTPGSAVTLTISAGGVQSNTVTIAVK